uniref:Uncharacterized protein n=1 Tax=Brassica campestris TaxID=3711 RepID=A0A3P6B4Z3_BRACM|nr:unnamed protein product [Brassica rapa]
MRFHSKEEHQELLNSVVSEYRLVKWLKDLKEAQMAGCRSNAEAERGYAEVELLSISELNEFIITAQPQEIKFVCTGGAMYPVLGAQKNSKELCRPLLAYRVEMSNADDTNEGLFVGLTKLHNVRAMKLVIL